MSSITLLRLAAIPVLGLAAGCSSAPPVYKDPVTWICNVKWSSSAPANMKDLKTVMAKARSKKEAEDIVMARGEPGHKEKVECTGTIGNVL